MEENEGSPAKLWQQRSAFLRLLLFQLATFKMLAAFKMHNVVNLLSSTILFFCGVVQQANVLVYGVYKVCLHLQPNTIPSLHPV